MITATAAPMSALAQLRANHVRPGHTPDTNRRACECCATVRPRDAVRMRRSDRRSARREVRAARDYS